MIKCHDCLAKDESVEATQMITITRGGKYNMCDKHAELFIIFLKGRGNHYTITYLFGAKEKVLFT